MECATHLWISASFADSPLRTLREIFSETIVPRRRSCKFRQHQHPEPQHSNTLNMKFLIQLLAILTLAYILELFFPWYYIAVASFVMGYALKSKANFLAGFLAIAILWFVKAYLQNSAGSTDLAERVANIFTLPTKELLFLITSIVGGLVGGFATWSGSLLKRKVKA